MKFLPLFPTGLPPAAIDKSGPLRRNPHCGRCSLSERAIKRCLPPVGEKGGLLLVAGSPDKQSNATGISFSSGGGRYAVGVAKKFWTGPLAGTYAAACHAGELAVEEKHLAKCRPYLRSFIDEIAPTRIVLLGGAAIRGVLGRYVHARSARCGFSWVTVGGRKVPVILLMNPDHPDQGGELDGRFAKAAFESDMQWACTVSDDFLRERREFIESSVYSVVSDEATALEAEEILRNEAKRLGRPVTWDVETRGKMFDSDFRIISAALGIAGTNISFVWDREALAKGSASSGALVRLLKDPDLCWVEQGSYDELAAMCYFGTPIAGERRDVRLVRKALDCAVKAADLDTLSELVGTGGYKADFEAHLKNAREKVKKWNPAQGMLFDECPDPTARQRLWDLSRLEDKKIFDEYEKSYLYALVPSDVLPLYNARDQITTGLLHEELWPKLQADPGLVLLWNEVTGPASRSYTWAEYWGAPMSRGAIRAVIQESKSAKAALEPQLRAHLTPQFAKVSFSSDEQVAGFLFTPTELGGLGLPVVKKTDTGAPSVDAEALETLYAQFNHPFIELFSAYVSQDTDRKKVEEFERGLSVSTM
jgi:uracil-DNA glycosylase